MKTITQRIEDAIDACELELTVHALTPLEVRDLLKDAVKEINRYTPSPFDKKTHLPPNKLLPDLLYRLDTISHMSWLSVCDFAVC
jgi:hypothetical protein